MPPETPPEVTSFLTCATPPAWFEQAPAHLDELLIDHANCEKKAASTALAMLYRYVDRPRLLFRLPRLAREELRHFEQVHVVMMRRGIAYRHLTPGRYARGLMDEVRRNEPHRLVDTLLVGAIVEARSCERFAGLAAVVPEDLAGLYRGLVACEARHFRHYLDLARGCADAPVDARLAELLRADADLTAAPDTEFRFHSGPLTVSECPIQASGKQLSTSVPSSCSSFQPQRSQAPST